MIRWLLFIIAFCFVPTLAIACDLGAIYQTTKCIIFLTSGTTFNTPADWSTTNTVEVIGASGNGGTGTGSFYGGGGAGGGYAKVSNLSLSGAISYQIGTAGGTTGAGTATANTWFETDATVLGGGGASASGFTAGATGSGNSVGTVKHAGTAGAGGTSTLGGGGGGAGGSTAAAGAASTSTGGAADSGGTGAGAGGSNAAGGNGTEWQTSPAYGSGGGGGGSQAVTTTGYAGGTYGGGGGGGGKTSELGGAGTSGLIVIIYTPSVVSTFFPLPYLGPIE